MKSWEESSWFSRTIFGSSSIEPVEHAHKLRSVLETLGDAFLIAEKGKTAKLVVVIVAAKIGAATLVPAGLFSLAALFGTASTGTAIGSLSGAAFNSAALAWLGGSMFFGAVLVGGLTLVGGVAALKGMKKLGVFQSAERDVESIPEDEKVIYSAIVQIVEKLNRKDLISGPTLLSFWTLNLEPMLDRLDSLVETRFLNWKSSHLKRLKKAIKQLRRLRDKVEYKLSRIARIAVPAFNASITKLVLEVQKYNEQDWLVMQAIRRSTNDLSDDASPEEIGEYLRNYSNPGAKEGVLNNAKGIYHELAYADRENNDGDDWHVELSAKTNEPGVDVWLVNADTQERIPYQLKATNSKQAVTDHDNTYDIPILGTEEIARRDERVESSGFTNEELTAQTKLTAEKLEAEGTFAQIGGDSLLAASVAGAISFSISLGESLKAGKSLSASALESLAPAKNAFVLGAVLATVTELTL
jgi:hypothetical protein